MNINKKLDRLLRQRRRAIQDLESATEGIFDMGVRIFEPTPEGVPNIIAGQNLIPRYEVTLEDYEWQVEFEDGEVMDQYEKGEQHHFGDIMDKDKEIKQVRYISNFETHSQAEEKRIIVTLNFDDGTFKFWNAGGPDIKHELSKPIEGEKKLILFKRRRETVAVQANSTGMKMADKGQKTLYTRYYLGFETDDEKRIVCCYPNGEIRISREN